MTDIEALAERVPGVDLRAVLRGGIGLEEIAIAIIDPAENDRRVRRTKTAADTGIAATDTVMTGFETAKGHLVGIEPALLDHLAVRYGLCNEAAPFHLKMTLSPRLM